MGLFSDISPSLPGLAADVSQACLECAFRVGRAARVLRRPTLRDEVLARWAAGERNRSAIARRLGVSQATVSRYLEARR